MKEGIWGIVIIAIIIAYCIFVIRRKIRDLKAGKYCGCGCSHCTGQCAQEEAKEK